MSFMNTSSNTQVRKLNTTTIKTAWRKIAALTIAASAILPMSANADTDGTVTINGVVWQYCDKDDVNKTVSIGKSGATGRDGTAMSSGTALDAADIPWTMEIEGETYTVTKVGAYAFAACYQLSGTLTIPEAVTNIGTRAFWSCKALTGIATLGGVTTLGDYAFCYSGVDQCHLACDFPDLTKVVSYSSGPFVNCVGLTGEAKLNPNLTAIPYRCFENSALTKVTIPRTVTSIGEKAFMQTKLTAFLLQGPTNVLSGTQTYAELNTTDAFSNCDRLKVLLFGKNTKGTNLTKGTMLTSVSGCTVFVPANGYWDGLVTGGTGNEVIYYGSGRELDIEMDDATKTITAWPTTEHAFMNVLNAAAVLKSEYGWNTRITVTNALEVASGSITAEMLAGVEFNSLLLMFAVKTQVQLDSILAAVPSAAMLAIDPTGATENLTIPQDRALWVYLSGNGKVQPHIKGLKIIFR